MIPTEALKEEARRLGFTTVGVAPVLTPPHWEAYREWVESGKAADRAYLRDHLELKRDPKNLLPEAQSVVVVTLNYNQPNPPVEGQPRIARYALGRDYHKVLRGKLGRLAKWIEHEHLTAKTRVCVDSAPIMERDFAQLAGLGWFGKNTLLIDSKRGSWFFLGVLLCSVPYQPDLPSEGGCGTCTQCIDACPTQAIVFENGRWQVDARACISYRTIEYRGEKGGEIGDWTFGCDVCQEVCPFNQPRPNQPQRAAQTEEQDFLNVRSWPSLQELAQIEEPDWDELTRGSAVRRAGWDGLRQNAQANLRAKR